MIIKTLSANDVGVTNSHQAGMLIPKKKEILSFFPVLTNSIKNPRMRLSFLDDAGEVWKFNFIYYNNKFFGGTRNEFRLTGMTDYFKTKNLKEGDKISFEQIDGIYYISHNRYQEYEESEVLQLSDSWISIKYIKP